MENIAKETLTNTLSNTLFEWYKEEIELSIEQNNVECDISSVVGQVLRSCMIGVSIRDVTTRRTTTKSKRFKGKAGFPDYIVFERTKSKQAPILGAVEVKRSDDFDTYLHPDQLMGHIESYGQVIYTDGNRWQYYEKISDNPLEFELKWSYYLWGHETVISFEGLLDKLASINWGKFESDDLKGI